mgnify:CR=1 FL=1
MVVPPLIAASILCCCFSDAAQAQEVTSSCHHVSSESEGGGQEVPSPQSAEDCECVSLDGFLLQKNVLPSLIVSPAFLDLKIFLPSSNNITKKNDLLFLHQIEQKMLRSSVSLLPIYIQNSNFRL